MAKRFRPNPSLTRELAAQPESRQALKAAADEVADHASAFAQQAREPWMRRQAQTIEVQQDASVTAVVNTDYGGHLVEFGSKNNPAYAPLRRAVRAAGLSFKEASKASA